MIRSILLSVLFLAPIIVVGGNDDFDTLSIKPIGVDYSKYSGTDKLYLVGECEGMEGNQVVIFQNQPSFQFFENNETYKEEQKDLEKAIWSEILDNDSEAIVVKGRWHKYNEKMVFLCHQVLKINESAPNANN